jgi:hypothetical protein
MNKDDLQKAIGEMSYFNAAEGNWGSEASARNRLKNDTAQKAIDAGLSYEQFKELYNSCEKCLTSFSDFGYSYRILMQNKEK